METAVEAVEEREGGKTTPDKVKLLNMAYKGMVQPSVVRRREKKEEEKEEEKGKVYESWRWCESLRNGMRKNSNFFMFC